LLGEELTSHSCNYKAMQLLPGRNNIWKHKKQQIVKEILIKKSNVGGITISYFKLYLRAIAIKTAWYWQENRYEDQWNRTENPDMNSCNNADLILDKGVK
jgi:hypothetical protein